VANDGVAGFSQAASDNSASALEMTIRFRELGLRFLEAGAAGEEARGMLEEFKTTLDKNIIASVLSGGALSAETQTEEERTYFHPLKLAA